MALLAGCNSSKKTGSEASPSPSARALTHEEYANQAAIVCSVSKRKPAPAPPATAADYAAAVRAQIAELKDLQVKLEALEPPPADRKQLQDQFLGPKAATIKAFEEALPDVEKAAATGDLDATKKAFTPAVQKSIDLAAGAAPFLTSYGLGACS
jgi:hypothetical protein